MDKKVIEITGLSKKYNNNILFENMGFTMNQGKGKQIKSIRRWRR